MIEGLPTREVKVFVSHRIGPVSILKYVELKATTEVVLPLKTRPTHIYSYNIKYFRWKDGKQQCLILDFK